MEPQLASCEVSEIFRVPKATLCHCRYQRAGLTIEGGGVVLTDNYLKVPVPPGGIGNRRVRVRITSAEPLAGALV